jgi:transposase
MGIPQKGLTDNMKSVVIKRDFEGRPVWNHDYEAFMKAVGFETKLCKPRHPFTKGKVERLVRFVAIVLGMTVESEANGNETKQHRCPTEKGTGFHIEKHYVNNRVNS